MPAVNVATLRTGLGRPDSKFPATPPQATAMDLQRILTNNWSLVGTHVSRAEAAWILEVGTHPNATAAVLDAIRQRVAGVTVSHAADSLGFRDWLTAISGPPSAGTGTGSPQGSVSLQVPASPGALSGVLIPQDERKVASTASHDILLASSQGGAAMPDFQLRRRDIADPEARPAIVTLTPADLQGVRSGDDFKALVARLFTDHEAYLLPDRAALHANLPEADRSNYAYLNISGRRLEQFFNELQRELERTGLSGDEAKVARMAINHQYRDAFRGRRADFDRADTGTYWSYGHDAAFVHVFEKMLEALPANDPKRPFIQNQIDFILTNKFTPHGKVNEGDIEASLELVAIDKTSRRVVSMTPDSDRSTTVRFETLQSGGRPCFRDGAGHYWEGTRTALTDAEMAAIQRTPVQQVVFRRPQAGEQLRNGMRFDWDRNRMINARDVDTSWWGHCDIKAVMEALLADMGKSGGVTEFRSDTGKTVEFSRALQLEALSALLNFDDHYVANGGQMRSFGNTGFAGGRNDDRPTQLRITTDRGQSFNLPIRLDTLSESGDSSKLMDVITAFNPKVADARSERFTPNADVRLDPRDPDLVNMDASHRKVGGTTDGWTFDDTGRAVEAKIRFEIDPAVTSGDRVLVGTELTDIASRQVQRVYFDPKTRELTRVDTRFVEQNGKYEAQEGRTQPLGKLRAVGLGKELTAGDDVPAKLAMIEEAVRTGRKIAADSDTGMQVWNGEVHAIRRALDWRSPDGRWERETVTIDATFGRNKVGTFLHQLDDEGRIVDTMEIEAAVDFYWSDNPRVAPLISERGNWWVNKGMLDRGVIDLGAGRMASIGAIQDLNDLVYLGLKATDNKKLFTVVHEGKRYVYEDEAAWRADVAKLQAGGGTPDPGGAGGAGGTTGPIALKKTPNLTVPDNDPSGVTDILRIDSGGIIRDVQVELDIKHTYIGDLDIALVAPDGTRVRLHNRGGREANDIVGTYGVDLRAADDLGILKGKDAKGDWQLKVVDLEGQDVGQLVSWGLKINT